MDIIQDSVTADLWRTACGWKRSCCRWRNRQGILAIQAKRYRCWDRPNSCHQGGASPPLTRRHLWLIALGVNARAVHCRPHEDVGHVPQIVRGTQTASKPGQGDDQPVPGPDIRAGQKTAWHDSWRVPFLVSRRCMLSLTASGIVGNLLLSKNAAVFNHVSTIHSKKAATHGSFWGFLTVSTCDARSTSTMTPCWMSIGLAALVMAYSYI